VKQKELKQQVIIVRTRAVPYGLHCATTVLDSQFYFSDSEAMALKRLSWILVFSFIIFALGSNGKKNT